MTEPVRNLAMAATKYNGMLRDYVSAHNTRNKAGQPLHIHDLSSRDDVQELRRQGYGVFVVQMDDSLRDVLRNPYDPAGGKVKEFVDKAILGNTILYDRAIVGTISNNAILSAAIGARRLQIGICAGVNPNPKSTGDTEFEVHELGNEGLVPWMFDNLTLITQGYDESKNSIDRSTARLVYMPSDNGLIYVLSPQVGHYAPHGEAFIMGVTLPELTNDTRLTAEESETNRGGVRYTARNKILASTQGTDGTTVKVVGETKAIGIIREVEIQAARSGLRDDLESILG